MPVTVKHWKRRIALIKRIGTDKDKLKGIG
jgi:hypothetical protein